MTDSGTGSSSRLLRDSMSFVQDSPADPRTPQGTLDPGSTSLSFDFSTPLGGNARKERIKQMTHNHVAFEKTRQSQVILVKAQHALRRMPGVSGQEANELASQLQEVGQIINQETMQLVDALVNVTLDQEETDRAIARMSIDANLAQARTDDQAQTISDLRAQLKAERDRRELVEADAKKVLERFETAIEELKRAKTLSRERELPSSPDDLVKVGESACRQGSPRVNENAQGLAESLRQMDRRTLSTAPSWLRDQRESRRADAGYDDRQMVPHTALPEAVKTPVESVTGDDALVAHTGGRDSAGRASADAMTSGSVRISPAFQHPAAMARTPMAAPPKFGPLQAGPPRAPAAMAHERRFQNGWAAPGRPFSTGAGAGFPGNSAFGNPPRKAGFQPLPRYRPNGAADCHRPAAGFGTPQDGGRPANSLDQRREYYPSTPPSVGRARYGRFGDTPALPTTPSAMGLAAGPSSSALVGGRGPGLTGAQPPIHLTERAVAAWSEQMMEFYGAVRHFVARHASEPELDLALVGRSSLWPVMLAMHHPLSESEAASYLGFHLRNEHSKACVVTRVMVDYVVNRVWVPTAWAGSDAKTTCHLLDLQRNLDATRGQPSTSRQPLLDQQASIVAHIMQTEQGTGWHRHKKDDIARALQATVQPLLNRSFAPGPAAAAADAAHRDLARVAELAWELSSKMLRSRLTFDFRFPDIGARFACQSMLPIWPRMDPAELQAKHWRVAFVTTPAITCRNDTGGSISAYSVSLADVLCMQ